MRVNGTAERRGDSIVVTTREVYSNCPQYITPRAFAPASLGEASRDIIIHRSLFFIAMAFLLIVLHQHPIGGGSSHAHSGLLIPALLALTGAALIMAMITGVRQLRLLLATGSSGQAITHYVVESGGMVAATAQMLAAALIGH